MRVAWLGEPASLDATTVGGKTANLGRLATSSRVPPGFCLDVSAFDQLRRAMDGDPESRARLRELVTASYADLARRVGQREPRVAVRSSAIGEDSGDSSFAGQHETILDVGGVDAIVDALLECWRSVSSDRAAAYRKQRGIAGAPRIAVLVQLMVPADASALGFSADPVGGTRDVVVVNAARGLGDAIASGTITPDSYTVRKRDLAITSRSCAIGAAVPDADIAAIARLAIQLETVMGGPVDIECALRDGELHLLQCRPITTLAEEFPVAWDDPDDAKLTWEREDAHFDRVFAPLSAEFISNGPDYGIQKRLGAIGFPLLVRHRAFNGRFYASEKPLVAEDRMPEKLIGRNGAEALALTQGQAPTLQRLEGDLHGLAEATRRWPAVSAALAGGERSVSNLAGLEGGPEFAHVLDAFLGAHGDIGQENFDLESAAWRDDPAKVLAVLAQRLRSEGEHPDARIARVRARATETLDRARAHLTERPEELARFEEIVAAATSAGPLTEEHNYWIDRVSQAHVRRLCLAFGERLVGDGTLASADEIFLLYVPEIASAIRTPKPHGELVARRRHELARWRRLAAPKTIGAPPTGNGPVTPGVAPDRVSFDYPVTQDDRYRLKGVAA